MEQAAPKPKATAPADFKAVFREYLLHSQVVAEDEADALIACLESPLPVCFRINWDGLESERLKKLFSETYQFDATKYSHNGVPINPPRAIPWYPQANTAWQVDCGRTAFSKSAHQFDEVRNFHACLLQHTEYGNIDRQEAVSMLPVLLLDVQPGQRILDMCASPGSKTTQIIDLLQHERGLVVANDMNKKRGYMLVHRLSRNTLQSAVVTCSPGQDFPGLYAADGRLERTNVFDRVLCDVPCSGDGTIRKNQALWKDWHIGQGLTLFPVQLQLALRGAALLRVGGTMVYSTCSFNPVEDEAVVAELLRRADGALGVVDVAGALPGLQARPGRTAWQVGWRSKSRATGKGHVVHKVVVGDKEYLHQWFSAYDDVPFQLQGDRVSRAMFPPTDATTLAALRRCLRLVPTDQDSGGFFIAVLRKTRELPGELQTGLPPLDELEIGVPPAGYVCKLCNAPGHYMKHCARFDETYEPAEPAAKKPKVEHKIPKEAPYQRVPDDVWATIAAYYGINDSSLKANLWCRSDTGSNIHYVEESIAASCLAGDALHIVNTGLKVFTKSNVGKESFYRPTQEGLALLRPYLKQRLLALSLRDLTQIIESEAAVPFSALEDVAAHPSTADLASLSPGPAAGELLRPATFTDDKLFALVRDKLLCNLWIGKGSFMPRLSKTTRDELKELIRCYL
ncbi:tRNA (cytosine-5-)-methyltransferase [Achlya hypogyna]|uniref:tRNA (Cytosine-5-)-methyltransferase n=1 Tax=Achlya hypogyna TaxID=1202772 RepID=A0A1V9ZKX6_ACHHY|nr:tRNA (cytosine-5-)-methyltransferase [Achlya hypogyna]